MPKDACIRTTPEERLGEGDWTVLTHLSAVLVELVSIIAAKKQIKEPIKVPRPQAPEQRPLQPAGLSGGQAPRRNLDAAFKQGIGVLAASSKKVRR